MFKNVNFLSHIIDDCISNLNFGTNFYVAGSGSANGMWIPDANPGDQNHADPWGCGSAIPVLVDTLPYSK
jgi:hypothetical protein